MGPRPIMENARNPTAVPDDPTHMAHPADAPHHHQSNRRLDGEKIGAALLFCGSFLALVGVTFTTTGWKHYQANPNFEWTRLLGPILVSVGGTFILTSVCKFRILSCSPCRQQEEEVFVIPVRDQDSRIPPFMFHGINQPVMLHGTTTMLCIPPAYNFVTPEVCPAGVFQPGSPVSGVHAALPSYDALFCMDNTAVTAGEGSSSYSIETDHRRSSVQKTEEEQRRSEESSSTCSHPPAYEDICPLSHKHNPS